MEHTGLLVHGDFIKESRLDTLFLLSKLLRDGTSAAVDVNDIKHFGFACRFLWLSSILC